MHANSFEAAVDQSCRIWMRQGRVCMEAHDWEGAVRAYAHGLLSQPMLGMHYFSNLQRARANWIQDREATNQQRAKFIKVVVVAAELSHNAAGRAFTLAQLYQHLGHPVELLGSHFPQWGTELWEPIQSAVVGNQLPVFSFIAEHETSYLEQAFELVLQHPADVVHLSKPRLPAVMMGLLYKLLWGAAVLVDIDDEELCFVNELEPITLDALKRLCHGLPDPSDLMGPLWTRLGVNFAQGFDGITVANEPLRARYGGMVIGHARNPEHLRPVTTTEKLTARRRFGVPQQAKVLLFFGTPRRHKGLLPLGEAVAKLPAELRPLLVIAGAFSPEDSGLRQELQELLSDERLLLLGNQPLEQAAQLLALADLVVLVSEGEVAEFQSPAKLSDALAMGLPALVSDVAPLRPLVEKGFVIAANLTDLAKQMEKLFGDENALQAQGERARHCFQESLALPVVAAQLDLALRNALVSPKPEDGQMINALESLLSRISCPLMAHRYQHWSERQIDWQALQQQERNPDIVTIVVPVYGDPAELDGCLTSVRKATSRLDWELIAVMNDDAPDSRAVLSRHIQEDDRIRAIWPGENVQFALGCNLGFSASQGEYVVFLNNDCRVKFDWLDVLIIELADPKVAAVQPRLLKPDGTVQCLGVVIPEGQSLGVPLYEGFAADLPCCLKEHHLEAVTGACIAVRAKDFASVRGFDAAYLNSQEDVDLCFRLRQISERQTCLCTPAATVIHSASKAPGRFRHTEWSKSRFIRIHTGYISTATSTGGALLKP